MKRKLTEDFLMLVIVTLLISVYMPYALAANDTATYEESTIATTTEVPSTESTTEAEQTTVVPTTEPTTEAEPTTVVSTTEPITEAEPTTVAPTTEPVTEEPTEKFQWQGAVLSPSNGAVEGPSGRETYYNLDMSGVISIMRSNGYEYEYWVRDDGAKMFGEYVMCAANLDLRPRGSIIETSLGTGIVCDTGGFAAENPTQLDIAVNW